MIFTRQGFLKLAGASALALGLGATAAMAQEVTLRLHQFLTPQANVVDLSAARETAVQKRGVARWGWIAGPALAASLAIVLFFPRESAPVSYTHLRAHET